MVRAPWLFATVQSYRKTLFQAMLKGEILLRNGVRRQIPSLAPGERVLQLVLRQGTPTLTLVVSTIAFDIDRSEESRRALVLLQALAELDLDLRVVAVRDSPMRHEARVRAWLQSQGGIAPSVQTRLEILDGTDPLVPVGADDIYIVTAGLDHAALLQERLARRMSDAEIHVLSVEPSADGLPEGLRSWPLPADVSSSQAKAALAEIVDPLQDRRPGPFAERSRLGLGYRMLKPLAEGHKPQRTCLFVHFDPHGRIDPHVMHYLSALRSCGQDIVLISSCDLQPDALAAVEPLTVAVVSRQNKGLDFSGWALAMELFPRLLQSESLLIANDSVYGPVGHLGDLFERMASKDLDVWGVIESRDIERHFQSWLVCFRGPVLQSEAFAGFWSSVLPLDDKRAVIREYEAPIWRIFETAGFRVGTAVPWESHRLGSNPAMEGWRMLLKWGCPFVKVQLLRDNPSESNLDGWLTELRQRGYPVELVIDHLYRVRGPQAAGLKGA